VRLTDLRAECATAVAAIRDALAVIAERRDAETIIEKGAFDLATGTDIASQRAIHDVLTRTHPEHGFLGEESGHDAPQTERSYFMVDPICGTSNFARGFPMYAVNISLIEDGDIVASAVGDGALGDIWVAERGRGAFALDGEALRPIRVDPKGIAISLDPGRPDRPARMSAATMLAAAVRQGRWELRVIGSSLDLAYVATGRLAGVWHFSKIPPLHFAAGVLLIREAGGTVTDNDGASWTLDSTGLLATATPVLNADLRALYASG